MPNYGYTRVSTSRQSEEGESLDVQSRTIMGYAMMHGLDIARTFVEGGVSGSTPLDTRPEGKALLSVLRAGDCVICAKLDRAFRSALDALNVLADFQKRGIGLHLIDLGGDVTGPGIGKLIFTILSAVAEAERDRIRERIATVKADQRSRGCYLGGKVPYGFNVIDGKLVSIPECEAARARIREMREAGLSLRAIQATEGLSLNTISNICGG